MRASLGTIVVAACLAVPGVARAQSPDHFAAAMLDEPEALDMTSVKYRPPSSAVLRNVEEILWGFRPDGSVMPTVADWTVSPDARQITFHIHPGVKFHSGDELTADDVVFSIARVTAHAPSLKRHALYRQGRGAGPLHGALRLQRARRQFLCRRRMVPCLESLLRPRRRARLRRASKRSRSLSRRRI